MTRLITGAGGSIGSELARLLVQGPEDIILLDNSEYALFKIYEELTQLGFENIVPIISSLDDLEEVTSILNNYSVRRIYNAAAYKHVNLVELNKKNGLKNNLKIIMNLMGAMKIATQEIELIQISTDKAVKPINMMGFSKRVCELYLRYSSTADFSTKIVRFGNVLDSNGSVVPIFREQIKRLGPVTVTSFKAKRYFMTIPQACELIISVEGENIGAGIYILDMGEAQSILKLAKEMIEDAGFKHTLLSEDGKIQIVEIGLRKGEKEVEELTSGTLCETQMSQILKADEELSEIDNKIIEIIETVKPNEMFDRLLRLYYEEFN